MKRRPNVLRDHELLRTLAGDPELLAIADAITATYPRVRTSTGARQRARWMPVYAAAAVVASVVFALVSFSPWTGAPSLTDRALAAVGAAPVLHLQLVDVEPAPTLDLVTVDDGTVIERAPTVEIWFDDEKSMKRSVTSIAGVVVSDVLESPGLAQPDVFTCSWIRAHPERAAQAGVSCPDGNRVTEPVQLDPALDGFVDGYRASLRSGTATRDGVGTVGGRDVLWLSFAESKPASRVALDATTYKPVRVVAGGQTFAITLAAAEPRAPTTFTQPADTRPTNVGTTVEARPASAAEAAAAIGGGQWLGANWHGFSIASIEIQERVAESPDGSRQPVQSVRVSYEAKDGAVGGNGQIDLYLARQCIVSAGWTCTARDPQADGQLGFPLGRDGWIGLLREAELYVSIWQTGTTDVPHLEVARALRPIGTP